MSLRRDPWTFALFAGAAAAVVAPVFHGLAGGAFRVLLLFAVCLVLFRRLDQIGHPGERLFWRDLAIGHVLLLISFFVPQNLPLRPDLLLQFSYYLIFLLALEQSPDRRRRWAEDLPDRRWETLSTVLFLVGLGAYFYGVPALLPNSPADASQASIQGFDLALQLFLGARFLHLARTAQTPRWFKVYRLFLIGCGLISATILFGDPWSLDELSLAPIAFALFAAARRYSDLPSPIERSGDRFDGARLGASLRSFLAALSFPLTHTVLDLAGFVPDAHRLILERQVLLWSALMGVFAIIQRWMLERRSRIAKARRLELGHELSHTKLDLRAILEQKERTERIRIAEESFAGVFRTFPEALVVLSLYDGKHQEINDGYARMISYPRDEILGSSVADLDLWIHPHQGRLFIELLEIEGRVSDQIVPFRNGSGEVGVLYFAGNLFEFDDQPCLLAVANDVTEACRKDLHRAVHD